MDKVTLQFKTEDVNKLAEAISTFNYKVLKTYHYKRETIKPLVFDFCKYCGIAFKVTRLASNCCCYLHGNRYRSKLTYNRVKLNPEYKAKRKAYFKVWLANNRQHFNDLCREPNRIRRKENYVKFKALGLCASCGRAKEPERQQLVYCKHCWEVSRRRNTCFWIIK